MRAGVGLQEVSQPQPQPDPDQRCESKRRRAISPFVGFMGPGVGSPGALRCSAGGVEGPPQTNNTCCTRLGHPGWGIPRQQNSLVTRPGMRVATPEVCIICVTSLGFFHRRPTRRQWDFLDHFSRFRFAAFSMQPVPLPIPLPIYMRENPGVGEGGRTTDFLEFCQCSVRNVFWQEASGSTGSI